LRSELEQTPAPQSWNTDVDVLYRKIRELARHCGKALTNHEKSGNGYTAEELGSDAANFFNIFQARRGSSDTDDVGATTVRNPVLYYFYCMASAHGAYDSASGAPSPRSAVQR